MKMFTVYDSKSELYSKPLFAPTTASGLRMFAAIANDNQTEIGTYPADFTLFETATFDDQTGSISPHKAHVNLGLAIDHLIPHEGPRSVAHAKEIK